MSDVQTTIPEENEDENGDTPTSVSDLKKKFQEEEISQEVKRKKIKTISHSVGKKHDNVSKKHESTFAYNADAEWCVLAAKCDYHAMARRLIDNPMLARAKDPTSGYTALHWACKVGNADAVKMLAGTYKASVDAKSNGGYTPLHIAAMFDHRDIYDLLDNTYGADFNIRDHRGNRPFSYLKQAASSPILRADSIEKETPKILTEIQRDNSGKFVIHTDEEKEDKQSWGQYFRSGFTSLRRSFRHSITSISSESEICDKSLDPVQVTVDNYNKKISEEEPTPITSRMRLDVPGYESAEKFPLVKTRNEKEIRDADAKNKNQHSSDDLPQIKRLPALKNDGIKDDSASKTSPTFRRKVNIPRVTEMPETKNTTDVKTSATKDDSYVMPEIKRLPALKGKGGKKKKEKSDDLPKIKRLPAYKSIDDTDFVEIDLNSPKPGPVQEVTKAEDLPNQGSPIEKRNNVFVPRQISAAMEAQADDTDYSASSIDEARASPVSAVLSRSVMGSEEPSPSPPMMRVVLTRGKTNNRNSDPLPSLPLSEARASPVRAVLARSSRGSTDSLPSHVQDRDDRNSSSYAGFENINDFVPREYNEDIAKISERTIGPTTYIQGQERTIRGYFPVPQEQAGYVPGPDALIPNRSDYITQSGFKTDSSDDEKNNEFNPNAKSMWI